MSKELPWYRGGNDNYILIGQSPVPCEDLLEWGRWMQSADRRVAFTEVGEYEVSTVFLGLDHDHSAVLGLGAGKPILFETMIFLSAARRVKRKEDEGVMEWAARRLAVEETADPDLNQACWRYATWPEAEKGHAKAVLLVEFATDTLATVNAEGTDRDE